MHLIQTPDYRHVKGRSALPYELHRIILSFFSVGKLIEYAQALEDAVLVRPGQVMRRIMGTLGSEDECSRRIRDSVWKKASESVSGHSLFAALLDLLLAKLNDKPLVLAQLRELSRCHLVVPWLIELGLNPLHKDHLTWIRDIHNQNPNIRWHLVIASGDLNIINDFELLGELKGTLDTGVQSPEDLQELVETCKKCHPDMRLQLKLHGYGNLTIEHLIDCTPVLKRLTKLTAPARNEKELRALDRICAEFTFDTALNIGTCCRVLRTCEHVPSTLVDLAIVCPTRDDLSWIEEIGRQDEPQLAIRLVDNVQTVSDMMLSRWKLTVLRIEDSLNDKTDVVLFKQLCQAHPNMELDVGLGHARLLNLLLPDLPMGMTVLHNIDGDVTCTAVHLQQQTLDADLFTLRWQPRVIQQDLQISCHQDCLRYLVNVDLSSLSKLTLLLTDDADLNETVIATILNKCPSMEYLVIDTDRRSGGLGEFPRILAKALDRNWPRLSNFTIRNSHSVFFPIILPGFVAETEQYLQLWRRKRCFTKYGA